MKLVRINAPNGTKEHNTNSKTIEEFKANCFKYLDAAICINRGEKIAGEMVKLYELIKKS
jgi:hypothetical protein